MQVGDGMQEVAVSQLWGLRVLLRTRLQPPTWVPGIYNDKVAIVILYGAAVAAQLRALLS